MPRFFLATVCVLASLILQAFSEGKNPEVSPEASNQITTAHAEVVPVILSVGSCTKITDFGPTNGNIQGQCRGEAWPVICYGELIDDGLGGDPRKASYAGFAKFHKTDASFQVDVVSDCSLRADNPITLYGAKGVGVFYVIDQNTFSIFQHDHQTKTIVRGVSHSLGLNSLEVPRFAFQNRDCDLLLISYASPPHRDLALLVHASSSADDQAKPRIKIEKVIVPRLSSSSAYWVSRESLLLVAGHGEIFGVRREVAASSGESRFVQTWTATPELMSNGNFDVLGMLNDELYILAEEKLLSISVVGTERVRGNLAEIVTQMRLGEDAGQSTKGAIRCVLNAPANQVLIQALDGGRVGVYSPDSSSLVRSFALPKDSEIVWASRVEGGTLVQTINIDASYSYFLVKE